MLIQNPAARNDSFCKLLLRGNALADGSPSGRTVTNINGVSVVADAAAPSGKALHFVAGSSQQLQCADSTDFDFDAKNFTIDLWVNYSGGNGALIARRESSGAAFFMLGWTDPWGLFLSATNGAWDIANGVSMGSRSVGAQHLAVDRNGTQFTTYKNGVPISQFSSSAAINAGTGYKPTIGQWGGSYYSMNLAAMRVSKGIARYCGRRFTPPTRSY